VGLGEVAGAFGLDNGDGEAGLFEGQCDGQFQAAGGFEDDADVGGLGREASKAFDQLAVAGGRVGQAEAQVGRQVVDVEGLQRDVDANEEGVHGDRGVEGSCETTTSRPNSCWRMRDRVPGDRSRLRSTNRDGGPN
jgi:hypothetical protein